MNQELPDVQAGFQRGRGKRGQIANICWIIEKAREFQKNINFCFIDYSKAFDYVDHNKLELRLPGEISITSNTQMIPLWSKEELKSLLMRVNGESEKTGLKLNIQKT